MKTVGIFEAKTKFSEICQKVAADRKPVIVTHRGKPLVRIEPIHIQPPESKNVWDCRDEFIRENDLLTEEFDLPGREPQSWRNPLQE